MGDEILTYRCPSCDRFVEGNEIKAIKAGASELKACARCGSALAVEKSRVVRPIAVSLAKASLYPLRPVTLGISLGVIGAAFGASLVLPLGGLLASAIRIGWLFAVLRASANGAEDPTIDATDVEGGISTWVGPGIRYFAATLVAFGPAIAAAAILGPSGTLVAAGLALAGSLYLPAALIVAAHDTGWLSALNPVPGLRLIRRIPGPYATACGLLFVLALVTGSLVGAARSLDIPIVSAVLESVLAYLPLVGAARMLGVLVYECREELD